VIWSAEHVEQLRSLWGRRLSAAEIGALIGCSRHAVIGKACRIGLPPADREPVPRPAVRRGPERRFPWIRKRPCFGKLNDAELADIPLPVIGTPRMLSIVELDGTTCRWPIGDPRRPSFGYCGHAAKAGSGYCDGHHAIAYKPVDDEDELLAAAGLRP